MNSAWSDSSRVVRSGIGAARSSPLVSWHHSQIEESARRIGSSTCRGGSGGGRGSISCQLLVSMPSQPARVARRCL